MVKQVHVVTGNAGILRNCLGGIPPKKSYIWIYLGKDAEKCATIGDIIGGKARREGISGELQNYARLHRDDYLDFIGTLYEQTDNPLWPLTSLAEKNPFVSDFFLYFCYLKTGLKFINERPENCIIVCEDRTVFDAIRENTKNLHQTVITFSDSAIVRTSERISSSAARVKNKFIFFVRFFLRILLARLYSWVKRHSAQMTSWKPAIVMHSWADSRSFAQESDYREIYLGSLAEKLETATDDFMYLVHILPTLWYPRALFNLLGVRKRIYLVEEFMSLGDILRSFFFVWGYYPPIPSLQTFCGLDVRSLLAHDCRNDQVSSRTEQVYLNYSVSRAICARFDVHSFVYSFENHIWEKVFCKGFRSSRGIKTVGYAIVFINRLYTCYSVSSYEREKEFLPDCILVSGLQGREMLAESGFMPEKIHVGGAIRYPGIGQLVPSGKSSAGRTILVILGPSASQSLEILFTTIEAFQEDWDLNIVIKCHPIVPYRSLSRHFSGLPDHFRIAEQSVEELLISSDLVIYADSTVCVEAIARKIPVLHLNSNFTIDINIFEGLDFAPSANSPRQVRELARKLLNSPKSIPDSSGRVIEKLFAPVDTQKILSIILGRGES